MVKSGRIMWKGSSMKKMLAKICQGVIDEFGMPVEWALCTVVSIFKRKGDIRNCSCYGAVKLLEHVMKVVERVL